MAEDGEIFDDFDATLAKKKKKPKKKFNDDFEVDAPATDADAAAANAAPAAPGADAGFSEDAFDLDMTKKKKKKKKAADFDDLGPLDAAEPHAGADEPAAAAAAAAAETPTAADAAAAAAAAADDAALDDTLVLDKKKKKKKTKALAELDDELLGGGDAGDAAGSAAAASAAAAAAAAAAEAVDFSYDALLERVFESMRAKDPEMVAGEKRRFVMKPPQVVRTGTKKVTFANFAEIAKLLHRSQDHLMGFLLAELGTSGSLDSSQALVLKGRFQQKQIETVLRHYIREYVTCHTCKAPDTILAKENRLFFLQCEKCGSKCSVASIKQGFVAVTGKRSALRAKTAT